MKQVFLIVILLAFSFSHARISYSNTAKAKSKSATCPAKSLVNESKELLKPDFIYDGFKLIKTKLRDEPQIRGIVVPVSPEVEFRYIFNRSHLPEGSEINVYRGNRASADTRQFSSVDSEDSESILVYKPERDLGMMYIEFKIPARGKGPRSGCVCVLAGYRL